MKTKIAVNAVCFVILIYLVLLVSVSGMTEAFPDMEESSLMLVLTLPSLTAIAGIIATPVMCGKLSMKTLTLAGLFMLLAGGAVCLLFGESYVLVLLSGAVMGVAYGMLSTVFPLIVNAEFSGDEQSFVMGMATGMLQLGRLVSLLIGGYLADMRWNYVYFTYIFVVMAIVIVIFMLPGDSGRRICSRENITGDAGKESPGIDGDRAEYVQSAGDMGGKHPHVPAALRQPVVWTLSLTGFLFAVLYFASSTHASVYIEGYGLGTASLTGTMSAVTCGVACAGAVLFSRIVKVTGRYSFSAVFLVIGAGFTVAGLKISSPAIFIGLIAAALGIALFSPYIMMRSTTALPQEEAAICTSIVLAFINIGYFVSPYITNFLAEVFSDGTAAAVYKVSGILSLIIGALLFILEADKTPASIGGE